jgi:hypothetical protein
MHFVDSVYLSETQLYDFIFNVEMKKGINHIEWNSSLFYF